MLDRDDPFIVTDPDVPIAIGNLFSLRGIPDDIGDLGPMIATAIDNGAMHFSWLTAQDLTSHYPRTMDILRRMLPAVWKRIRRYGLLNVRAVFWCEID